MQRSTERRAREALKGNRGACLLPRTKWELLVEEFRRATSAESTERWSFLGVGKACGVDYRTAQRAYEVGWYSPTWAQRAIKDVLQDDRLAARAILAETDDRLKARAERLRDERELARLDSAAESAREAQVVRGAISAAMSLMGNAAILSKAAPDLSNSVARQIRTLATENKIPPEIGLRMLQRISSLSTEATQQLEVAMRVLRKHLGVAEGVIGVVNPDGPVTLVDGRAAIAALGEDQLKQAVKDLADGNMSEAVDALIGFQVERGELANRASPLPH